MICPRCGSADFIDHDGPLVCRYCLRSAVAAVTHPELLSNGVIKLLERDHPDVVLGFRLGQHGALVREWRWTA